MILELTQQLLACVETLALEHENLVFPDPNSRRLPYIADPRNYLLENAHRFDSGDFDCLKVVGISGFAQIEF